MKKKANCHDKIQFRVKYFNCNIYEFKSAIWTGMKIMTNIIDPNMFFTEKNYTCDV